MIKEFKAFVLRGNVVDLAVGVVIGAAFGEIVQSFTKALLNPLIGLFGNAGLDGLRFRVDRLIGEGHITFRYGLILDAILNFVLIAAIVFFFVVKPLNHLMARMKTEEPVVEATRDCPECLSSIPRAARRCAFCTAEVAPA